jgi:hypothetical protein
MVLDGSQTLDAAGVAHGSNLVAFTAPAVGLMIARAAKAAPVMERFLGEDPGSTHDHDHLRGAESVLASERLVGALQCEAAALLRAADADLALLKDEICAA